MDNSFSKDEIIKDIPDSSFLKFQSIINPEKIFQFSNESKNFIEKSKSKENSYKINKSNFFSICKKIFSSKYPNFYDIYELIFERFKEKKCIFNMDKNIIDNAYCLLDIYSTEKIEIYVVEIFFCAIMMTEFKKKIETMFYITDADSDGLINEEEIKKIILTANKLFCEESAQYFPESTLIQQSLSCLKAKKVIENLLYWPGELKKKLEKSRYIPFGDFYDSLIKIENYKYDIIPTFINLKKCLYTQRKEIEFIMKKNCKKDFLKISYDLINEHINLNSVKNILKKCFDPKKHAKKKKLESFKEINKKKEKDGKINLKKLFRIKKSGYDGNRPSQTSLSFYVDTNKNLHSYNENDYKIKYNTDRKNDKNSHISTIGEYNNDNNFERIEKNKGHLSNKYNKLKKTNSLDYKNKKKIFIKKLDLIKRNSTNPNSFLNFKKKGILHPSYNPLSFSQVDSLNKSSSQSNKKVSFSSNKDIKQCLSQEHFQQKTTSNFNLETSVSASRKKSSFHSEEIDLTSIKFHKIPLINISKIDKNENNKNAKIKSLFRKSLKNREKSSNNFSKINFNRSKSIISIMQNIKINNKKNIEKGDYYKFTSLVFPPCIINNREKEENIVFVNEKYSKSNRVIDEYNCLLKPYDEVKNEVLDELKEQRNKDIHAFDVILKIKNSLENKKHELLLLSNLKKNQDDSKY